MEKNSEDEPLEKTAKTYENDEKIVENSSENGEIYNNDTISQSKFSRFIYNLKGILSLRVSNIILFLIALFFGFMIYFFAVQVRLAKSAELMTLFRVFIGASIAVVMLSVALLIASLVWWIKRIKNKDK